MEEPIYMPQHARPMSPVASYQPGHFPHEAYYNQQQYATIDKANKYRKNKGGKASKANSSKNTSNGGSKHPSSDSNAGEDSSDFAAGIYKRGHINERAFSYSIRNEQRSRSYGSLANMPMGPNGEPIVMPNGEVMVNGGGEEKMAHMMSELELGEDQIERSEVPPGLYPHGGYPPPPPPHAMYGGPPHMMMMPGEPGMMMPPMPQVNGKKKGKR